MGIPPFTDLPLKAYRLHFEVNVFAAYRLMQLVLPDMIDQRRGSLLNISSDAAHRPGEGRTHDPANACRSVTEAARRPWNT